MPLSVRAQAILATVERELPSRGAPRSSAEKLDLVDRLKEAADEYERTRPLELAEPEKA